MWARGQCTILYAGDQAVVVDCGSSNSYIDAGGPCGGPAGEHGYPQAVGGGGDPYHADHTNGLYELLARMQVQILYLPDIEDEYGVRDRLLRLAREMDIAVDHGDGRWSVPGRAMLTVYPPVGEGDLNEQGADVPVQRRGF